MVVNLGARFVVYDPAGSRRGELPHPMAAQMVDVFNDIGSGSLDYHIDAPHSKLLDSMCEIAVEVNNGSGDGTTWVEPGARLLWLKRGTSQVDELRTRRYTLQSYGFQLGKMRMLREELLNENGERLFESMTAGAIVKTLFDETKARGNVPSFSYDFSATHDSAGQPWGGMVPPVSQRYGDTLLDLLRQFADSGICDWRIVGRTLKMYKPDGLGTNRASSVRLLNGFDVIEAPDDQDATELAGRIGVQGDEGRTYEAVSPSSGSWGLWEEMVNASGVKDIGGLQFIGEAEQRRRSAPRVQMTRKLRTHGVVYLPFFAYNVGDIITAPDDSGALAALRVRELQLHLAADGLSVNATLNDRILERDIKDRRNWQGMLGGASSSSGGTGAPSGPNDDKRKPAAPTGLVVTSVHQFTPEGAPFAVIDAVFTPVSNGVDGKPIAIEKHELWVRINAAGEPWRLLTESAGMDSRITYSPMNADEKLQFKLRAISRTGVPSDFGSPVSVTTGRDTTPPPQPAPFSTPQTRLGQIILPWSGLDKNGVVQPVDWSHGIVWMATSSTGAGTMIGRVDGAESFVVPMQPYNQQRWFFLTSYDTSGNVSTPSTRVSASTQPLVDTDLIGRVIDGANLKLDSITDELLSAPIKATLASADGKSKNWYQATPPSGTDHKVGDTWFETDADNKIHRWTGSAWVVVGLGSAALSSAVNTAISDAQSAATAAQTTADGKSKVTRSTAVPSGAGSLGDQWWRYSGSQIIGLWIHSGSAWVSQTLTDQVITNLNAGTITAGTLHADRIAANSITGAKIAANTITANEMLAGTITASSGIIANAAISNAQIANVDAGKIVTGTLDANRIGANTITTNKMFVGSFENLVIDPSGLFPIADSWASYAGGLNEWSYFASSVKGNVLRAAGNGVGKRLANRNRIQVRPGEQYVITAQTQVSPTWVGRNPALRMTFRDAAGGLVPGSTRGAVFLSERPGNWEPFSYIATVPDGADIAYADLEVEILTESTAGTTLIADLVWKKAVTSELLVDGAVISRSIATDAVVSRTIAALQIEAGHIKANAITADKINAGAITAVKLDAGAVTVDKLAARSITVDKMAIGDYTNVATGSDFENASIIPWDMSSQAFSISTTASRAHSGTRSMSVNGAAPSGSAYLLTPVDVNEGERWYVELWASRSATWDGTGTNSKLRVGDQTDAHIYSLAYTPAAIGPANAAPVKLSGQFVVPAGATGLRISLRSDATAGFVWIDDIVIRRMTGAELIVNGAITADKIAANAVTAGSIAANAITADKLHADAITGKTITASTITGGTINGAVINGVQINTDDGLTITPGGSIKFQGNTTSGIQTTTVKADSTGLYVDKHLTMSAGTTLKGANLDMSGNVEGSTVRGTYRVQASASNYLASAGTNQLTSTAIDLGFTSSSANVYSSGNSTAMARTSSMRKLKLDREPITADYRILDLPPMTWRDRAEVEANPDTKKRVAGFVAEDLATLTAFTDNAFDALLVTDDEGRATGINYDRVPAYLIPLISDMHERLIAAETQLAELAA